MPDNEILNKAIEIAKEMGLVLKDNFGKADAIEEIGKGASGDTTIKADKLAEDKGLEMLKEFGDCEVFSEEAGTMQFGEPKYRWCIDPLDGSNNFARGIPFFSVSIYVSDMDKKPVAGVVYDPLTDECFSSDGERSFLNGQELKTVSRGLEKATFDLQLTFVHRKDHVETFCRNLVKVGDLPFTFRRFGSCALELALCATGKLDSYLDIAGNVRFFDIAAAALIVEKAGGKVTDLDGKEIWDENFRGIVACPTPELHAKIMELLK